MNRRQKIIVSITGIFIVLLALVGLTYAYFLTRITGNENEKSISVTTANLDVTYNDDMDGDGEPDAIMIFENIQPSNTKTYTKTFKVENTGNATATYSVILDNMENDFERNQDLEYTLTRSGIEGNIAEGNLVVGTKQILIPSVEIANEGIHTYTLTIKYIETGTDQSEDMGKSLSFRVNIDNETVTWHTAEEGTLLYAIKNNQPTGGNETTNPGLEASAANEKRILSVEDDYGTSHVYRGNVDNNYVTYSNMCWRIVRVQGDGTIKLVLADKDHQCGTANGYSITDNDSALVSSSNYITYDDAMKNERDGIFKNSNIPNVLSTWANNTTNPLNMKDFVKAEWCNDVSKHTVIHGYDEDGYGTYDEGKIDTISEEWHISTTMKKLEVLKVVPDLKCNMKGEDNTKALRYENELGILSAIDFIYSGTGINSFLYTNANAYNYWTMTPQRHNDSPSADIYIMTTSGSLSSDIAISPNYYIRPSVVLRSDVKLKADVGYTQDGTVDKPYVIE